jgi:uncharacterized protein YggE
MGRARAMAAGAKLTLASITKIENQTASFQPPMQMPITMRAVAEAPAQTPITPGEIEIRAQVTLTINVR